MRLAAVIVCFNPDRHTVFATCATLASDGCRALVVDNTEQGGLGRDDLPGSAQLVSLGLNTGIAHAQNVGISNAIEAGAEAVLLLDQDSRIESGFVLRLTAPLRAGVAAVVGPCIVDDATGAELPAVRLNAWGLGRPVYALHAEREVPADILIASGTAATTEVFALAGNLDEDFFIDYVDTEWCLRCRQMAIPLHVVPGALMRHTVGTAARNAGPFTVQVHSPARCYYQLRNCLLLFRKRAVPSLFALKETLALLASRLLLLAWVDDRASYWRACLAGVRDGLKGVTGVRRA